MKAIKKIFIDTNSKFIGLLIAGFSLLLSIVFYFLFKANIISRGHVVVQTSMIFVSLSPILAIILTSIQLRLKNASDDTFEHWLKATFINFLIAASILVIIVKLFNQSKDILKLLLLYKFYMVLFVPLIGLAISVFSTLMLKRGS